MEQPSHPPPSTVDESNITKNENSNEINTNNNSENNNTNNNIEDSKATKTFSTASIESIVSHNNDTHTSTNNLLGTSVNSSDSAKKNGNNPDLATSMGSQTSAISTTSSHRPPNPPPSTTVTREIAADMEEDRYTESAKQSVQAIKDDDQPRAPAAKPGESMESHHKANSRIKSLTQTPKQTLSDNEDRPEHKRKSVWQKLFGSSPKEAPGKQQTSKEEKQVKKTKSIDVLPTNNILPLEEPSRDSGFFSKLGSLFKKEPPPEDPAHLFKDTVLQATSVAQLPRPLQKVIADARIEPEHLDANFHLVKNILSFQYKVKFTGEEPPNPKHDIVIPPPKTERPRPHHYSEEALLTEGDPKALFKTLKEEGKGGFGVVFAAHKRGDKKRTFAVKILKNTSTKEKRYNLNEIAFLKFCKCPNVVSFMGAYKQETDYWLVMEFMEGGTLDQAVKAYRFPEKQITYITREIVKGIDYLHAENLIHRDLKSANIMMTINGDIKLIDFGLCVDVTKGPRLSMVGSPYWMPPEMIQRQFYASKVDIWSLGICLMELANGRPPNHKSPFRAMFMAALEGYPDPLEKPKTYSTMFNDFLNSCLAHDPKKRPSASELLKHPCLDSSNCDTAQDMKQVISGIFVLTAVLPF